MCVLCKSWDGVGIDSAGYDSGHLGGLVLFMWTKSSPARKIVFVIWIYSSMAAFFGVCRGGF